MAAGIYIHIPFCIRKCHYCDFFSIACDDPEMRKSYAMAILQEISYYGKCYGKDFVADSVFFGGGTPSLMEPELINNIISALKKNFTITEDVEITMECNPATLTPEKLAGYKDAGVNRLSIGVQSLNDEVLEELGRLHTSEDVVKTFKMARKAKFDNISLDLMFSVPKQGIRDWRSVVKRTAGLKPEHMSIYSLEIAENTEFGRRLKNHEMEEQIFSVDRTMYRIALEALRKRGLYRYEISNVARPGKECRHNLKYWSLEDYMALGAGSHGYIKGVRYSNVSNIENYISMMKNQDLFNLNKLGESEAYGADCVDYYHINSFMDNVSEYTFTALRTRGGVDFKRFEELFNRSFWDVYSNEREEFDSYVRSGFAVSDDEHIALTLDGIDISNRIMAIFV